ncbi:hypothetical protein BDQ17DRAFT_845824 [Cyathus striatus]|nr:hypothetical protein BDQ17DRAFT_845824 [Cyathus striatus]
MSVDSRSTAEHSEEETSVNTIPSYERAFLPSDALLRAPRSCEVYTEKMFPMKYGYPLWFPQPDHNLPLDYRLRGVSIGDIGAITPDGAFDFMFNIGLPPSHPINFPAHLPDDFAFFPSSNFRTRLQTLFNPGADSKVSNLNIVSNFDTYTNDISFSCNDGARGAILSMPDGSSQEDLINERQIKEFISNNALDWYRYAQKNCGRELDRHSLYLVTGYMKSKTWVLQLSIKTYQRVKAYW